MRFVLLVEGRTEKALVSFFRRWLDARVEPRVGIQTSKPGGGCCRLLEDMPKKARMYLNGSNAGDLIGVVGLLDLHGLPHPSHVVSTDERIDWWTREIESKVGDPHFRVFFAVHDVEAWLLSQPEIFPREMQSGLQDKAKAPERVDFDNPPAKLLQRLYRDATGREYKKTVQGIEFFGKLDPELACSKCPQLKRLLGHLLEEASRAGHSIVR